MSTIRKCNTPLRLHFKFSLSFWINPNRGIIGGFLSSYLVSVFVLVFILLFWYCCLKLSRSNFVIFFIVSLSNFNLFLSLFCMSSIWVLYSSLSSSIRLSLFCIIAAALFSKSSCSLIFACNSCIFCSNSFFSFVASS